LKDLTLARLVLLSTIVAAFPVRIAARSLAADDVPVPGGLAGLAQALGVDPVPDRARFVSELTRLKIDIPAAVAFLARRPAPADPVPVPLATTVWAQAIFRHPIKDADLFGAIISDRHASFVCHALAALDDETLQFFGEHPVLLRRVYENRAGVFAAFGSSIRVSRGRVVTAGGDAGARLWEAALKERTDQPERFIEKLLERDAGRVAYLYDVLSQLDAPTTAFALGLWIPDPSTRTARFDALLAATVAAASDWQVAARPFNRPVSDIGMLLARVRTDATGSPILGRRQLWARAFEVTGLPSAPAALLRASGKAGEEATIDAAWLIQAFAKRSVRDRENCASQLTFGQRVFPSANTTSLPDVLVALRAVPQFRMLMLTLERIGVTDPAVFASAARQAQRLSTLAPNQVFVVLAQFQGAIAVVTRLARVRTVDGRTAEHLISTLAAVPLIDGRYSGGIVRWMDTTLRPALRPPSAAAGPPDVDDVLLAALAGPRPTRPANTPIVWEGQQYRFDPSAAELRRLRRIFDKQAGYTVNLASALDAAARPLSGASVTADDVRASLGLLKAIAVDFTAAATTDPRDTRGGFARAMKTVGGLESSPDANKADRAGRAIDDLADVVLAEALLSTAYAVEIADPEGSILIGGNAALRHDFGQHAGDATARTRAAWSLPQQEIWPGTQWHVSGSLLGLDVALAPLGLRRVNADHVSAPTLVSNERETFAISLALLNPIAINDVDRDLILDAVERGRLRIRDLTPDRLDAAAADIDMDGWRHRAARWMLANDPARVPSLFSLAELVRLGGGAGSAELDAWGMSALALDGCLCTRFRPRARWTLWTGHPQLGLMGANISDLNIQIAAMLRDLHLPAGLTRYVLAAAVQDFIDEVKPTDPDDWLTLVRSAGQVSRERVEDYVAAAAADGPLVPLEGGL
jgi:hypothetical protein